MSTAQYPALFYISDNYDATSSSIAGVTDYFLSLQGDTLRVTTKRTISTSTDAGYPGEICFDDDYMYYCVSGDGTNGNSVWKRIALGTF